MKAKKWALIPFGREAEEEEEVGKKKVSRNVELKIWKSSARPTRRGKKKYFWLMDVNSVNVYCLPGRVKMCFVPSREQRETLLISEVHKVCGKFPSSLDSVFLISTANQDGGEVCCQLFGIFIMSASWETSAINFQLGISFVPTNLRPHTFLITQKKCFSSENWKVFLSFLWKIEKTFCTQLSYDSREICLLCIRTDHKTNEWKRKTIKSTYFSSNTHSRHNKRGIKSSFLPLMTSFKQIKIPSESKSFRIKWNNPDEMEFAVLADKAWRHYTRQGAWCKLCSTIEKKHKRKIIRNLIIGFKAGSQAGMQAKQSSCVNNWNVV